jgi:hypothetical protein
MKNPTPTFPLFLAPCGIDCRLCRAYTRERKPCPGCRLESAHKSPACVNCRMKNCEKLVSGKYEFCFECDVFPCALVKHLDQRYRTRYATSPIANLRSIQAGGIQNFMAAETRKWTCSGCGALLCMHKPECLACGTTWHFS